MTDLTEALGEIRSIRRQVAEATEFRGYGPLTLFTTAALAIAAGAVQRHWVAQPAAAPARYVALWLATGVLCAMLIATQMLMRARRLHSGMADEMVAAAVTQFLPAGVAGIVLPLVLLRTAPDVCWMLPGLWQIIFSLGIFSSRRSLPPAMMLAGAWFFLTGVWCLAFGGPRALGPGTMSVPYAVGMAMVATIHSISARRAAHDEEQEF